MRAVPPERLKVRVYLQLPVLTEGAVDAVAVLVEAYLGLRDVPEHDGYLRGAVVAGLMHQLAVEEVVYPRVAHVRPGGFMPLIASSVTVVFMEQTAVCMPRTLTCAARTRSARASSLTVPSQPEQISSAAAQEASAPPPCPPRPSATTRQSRFRAGSCGRSPHFSRARLCRCSLRSVSCPAPLSAGNGFDYYSGEVVLRAVALGRHRRFISSAALCAGRLSALMSSRSSSALYTPSLMSTNTSPGRTSTGAAGMSTCLSRPMPR